MSNLVPRVFQAEAAREALRGNRIIRADTGTGKTLIAVLLLKHIAATTGKFAVFIAPNVTLVYQQANAIQESTNLKVSTFVGADGVDFWKREQWVEKIQKCDVGIMTLQVLLNLCDNAYWTFDQIGLIVFDECHNCSKKHPGAVVMRNHYHPLKARDSSVLPRILGLTASPIYNVKRPEKTIAELEAVLDARILEVTSASSVSRKAEEHLIEYVTNLPGLGLLPEDQTFLELLSATTKTDPRASARATACQELFGRVGLDLYLQELAAEHEGSDGRSAAMLLQTNDLAMSSLSPKLVTLIQCLEEYIHQKDFHAIVFVQQRHHAKILSHILSLCPSLRWIKPGFLTGHGGHITSEEGSVLKDRGMEVKEQQETVKRFRAGELNLIVATSVAEEGLDFQACNLVVRFDSLQTITGYIQSRGRARAANARFVVIAESGSEEAQRYRTYVAQEEELKILYADRPEDEPEEPELDNLPSFSTTTGALLTFQNSAPVYRWLETQSQFCCELTVPKIAALSHTTYVSELFTTKKAARQHTAYNCCIALYTAGALNEHLLPVRERLAEGAKDARGRDVDRSVAPQQIPVSIINPFGNIWTSSSAYLHAVEIVKGNAVLPLGLLCATPQSRFDDGVVFGMQDLRATIRIKRITQLKWGSTDERDERLRQLETFNRLCVRILLDRRLPDEDKFFVLWVPISNDGTIDIALVDQPSTPLDPLSVTPEALFIVPFRRPHHRFGRFLRVRKDVDSTSKTADIISDPPRKKIGVVTKYPDYAKYVSTMYEHHELKPERPEAIVEFQSVSFSPYFLGSTHIETRPVDQLRIFPASMCHISLLPLSFWEAFSMTPALKRLISARTTAQLAFNQLGLPALDVSHFVKALTPPSSLAGVDYEYLETLGDSFLKVATSIHIYLDYPNAEEGRMSILRMNSVDNRFLRQQCIKTGLARFIQVSSSGSAVPQSTIEGSCEEDSFSHTISRKILADVVEAVLGAAALSGGVAMALKTGEELGLCFGGISAWHDRVTAKLQVQAEAHLLAPSLRFLEDALGYKIQNQSRLLIQAITHRSFPGEGYCYEREEYLGDALLDWWATTRLFPMASSTTPRLLTFRRAILVSNPTLALLAIRKLGVHKSILHNSAVLETAIREAVEVADKVDWKEVIAGDLTWIWSPPKVLGDVFEALLAVVFVDSNFDLDSVFAVLDRLYEDIMPFVESETERRDPHSRLLMWKDVHACTQFKSVLARSESTDSSAGSSYTSTITVHSVQIAQQTVPTKSVARQLAASQALDTLEAEGDVLCDCKEKKAKEKLDQTDLGEKVSMEEVEMEAEDSERGIINESILRDDDVDLSLQEEGGEDVEMMEEDAREAALPLRVREY